MLVEESAVSETGALTDEAALAGAVPLFKTTALAELLLDAEAVEATIVFESCCSTCSVLIAVLVSVVAACAVAPLPK